MSREGIVGYLLCISLYFVDKEVAQTLDFVNPTLPGEKEMLEKADIDREFI